MKKHSFLCTQLYTSLHLKSRLVLQHLLELLELNLTITRVVHRTNQLLDVDRQLELLLYYPHQHLPIDVARPVRRPPNGSIGIQSNLVIFPINLRLSLSLIDLQNLFEQNNSLVIIVQLGYQLAQLKLLKMQIQSLQDSLEIIDTDLTVTVIIKVLNSPPTKANVLLSQNVLHSSILLSQNKTFHNIYPIITFNPTTKSPEI